MSNYNIESEFVGAGIRPPGIFHMSFGESKLSMNTCIFISSLHKLIRRNETGYLNCILKGAFIALDKRELTSGIKSVWTQFRNRMFITLIEEGVLLFVTLSKAMRIMNLVIQMFDSKDLNEQLSIVDNYCNEIHGCYRGRVASCINSWFSTDPTILEKLQIPPPPQIEHLSRDAIENMMKCKLTSIKGKREFKAITKGVKDIPWVQYMIDAVSHVEFNKLLYYSTVALSEYEIENDIECVYNGEISLPSMQDLDDIGVLDCHSGKGDFNEFLKKGVLVTNKAPINIYGLNGDELESMYIRVKEEIGSRRYSKKQNELKAKRIAKENKKILGEVNKVMNRVIGEVEKRANEIENPVIAQLPTGKYKPVVLYDVVDGYVDGSGYKQFRTRVQYLRCKQHEDLLKVAGSPAMPDNTGWDDENLRMHFKTLGKRNVCESEADDKISFGKPVRVMKRQKLGITMLREIEDEDIVVKNTERFIKHCIVAALLNIGDQSPNNFIMDCGGDTIYAVDNADKRTSFNMNETDFVNLLTNKPMKKNSFLRKQCQQYVCENKEHLVNFINSIDGNVLKVMNSEWELRKQYMINVL